MPSTSSSTPVLSSSGVSQPDNAGVTAKESDTGRVLLSMKFCFSAPPLTLFTLQWAYTMLLSPPPRKILDPTLHPGLFFLKFGQATKNQVDLA